MSGIVTTHRHEDHWTALAATVVDAGAAAYAGEEDADDSPSRSTNACTTAMSSRSARSCSR